MNYLRMNHEQLIDAYSRQECSDLDMDDMEYIHKSHHFPEMCPAYYMQICGNSMVTINEANHS